MLTGMICGALGLGVGFAAGILLSAAGPGWEQGSASVLWWSGVAFWAVMLPALACIVVEATRLNQEKRRRQQMSSSLSRLAGLHDRERAQ